MPCGALLGLAAALLASPSPGPAWDDEPSLEQLVGLYRSGDKDEAAALASRWDPGAVEEQTRRLSEAAASLTDPQERETLRLAAAAIVTESALLHLTRGGEPRRARRELEEAVRLVAAEPLGPRGDLFARRLCLLATLVLHSQAELAAARALVGRAIRRYPDDPELITALGSVMETVASLRQYERPPSARGPWRLGSGGYRTEAGGRGSLWGASLPRVETRYEQAVALDPDLLEARLRLGRVRLAQGRAGQALPDLERVAVEARRPAQRYLARLFLGRAREKLGDVAGAALAFRTAVAHAPGAQTGLLALGRSLDRLGDAAGAQEAFEQAGRADAPFDPWLGYQLGQPRRIGELAAELRGLVW